MWLLDHFIMELWKQLLIRHIIIIATLQPYILIYQKYTKKVANFLWQSLRTLCLKCQCTLFQSCIHQSKSFRGCEYKGDDRKFDCSFSIMWWSKSRLNSLLKTIYFFSSFQIVQYFITQSLWNLFMYFKSLFSPWKVVFNTWCNWFPFKKRIISVDKHLHLEKAEIKSFFF